jgi:hypothetical protein
MSNTNIDKSNMLSGNTDDDFHPASTFGNEAKLAAENAHAMETGTATQ